MNILSCISIIMPRKKDIYKSPQHVKPAIKKRRATSFISAFILLYL